MIKGNDLLPELFSEQLSSIDVADWYLTDMFGSATISAFQRRADIP